MCEEKYNYLPIAFAAWRKMFADVLLRVIYHIFGDLQSRTAKKVCQSSESRGGFADPRIEVVHLFRGVEPVFAARFTASMYDGRYSSSLCAGFTTDISSC